MFKTEEISEDLVVELVTELGCNFHRLYIASIFKVEELTLSNSRYRGD